MTVFCRNNIIALVWLHKSQESTVATNLTDRRSWAWSDLPWTLTLQCCSGSIFKIVLAIDVFSSSFFFFFLLLENRPNFSFVSFSPIYWKILTICFGETEGNIFKSTSLKPERTKICHDAFPVWAFFNSYIRKKSQLLFMLWMTEM